MADTCQPTDNRRVRRTAALIISGVFLFYILLEVVIGFNYDTTFLDFFLQLHWGGKLLASVALLVPMLMLGIFGAFAIHDPDDSWPFRLFILGAGLFTFACSLLGCWSEYSEYRTTEAIKLLAEEPTKNFDELAEIVKDGDYRFAPLAISAIGRAKDPRAVPILVDILKSQHEHLADEAIEALREVGCATDEVVDALEYQVRSGGCKIAAAELLVEFDAEFDRETCITILQDLLADCCDDRHWTHGRPESHLAERPRIRRVLLSIGGKETVISVLEPLLGGVFSRGDAYAELSAIGYQPSNSENAALWTLASTEEVTDVKLLEAGRDLLRSYLASQDSDKRFFAVYLCLVGNSYGLCHKTSDLYDQAAETFLSDGSSRMLLVANEIINYHGEQKAQLAEEWASKHGYGIKRVPPGAL